MKYLEYVAVKHIPFENQILNVADLHLRNMKYFFISKNTKENIQMHFSIALNVIMSVVQKVIL